MHWNMTEQMMDMANLRYLFLMMLREKERGIDESSKQINVACSSSRNEASRECI